MNEKLTIWAGDGARLIGYPEGEEYVSLITDRHAEDYDMLTTQSRAHMFATLYRKHKGELTNNG